MKPLDSTTDRETLSALFDGELQGEARLFAMRRLSHDAGWQEDCGRWQMIGDAMRRQAPIAAPADLTERVRRSIEATPAELAPAPVVATVARPSRRPVRLWVGSAMAASVALMAVFATRTPQDTTPAPASTVAVTPSATAPVMNVAASTPATVVPTPVQAPIAERATPAAVQVARVERAAVERPATRVRREAPSIAAPAATQAVAAAAFLPPEANPFHVPEADPLAGRPWPRAALPGTGGAFTARYGVSGDSRTPAPSFYPFEPRMPNDGRAQDDATP